MASIAPDVPEVYPGVMSTIAAIYVRVSDPSQESNYSLPTQEAACREFAAREGFVVSDAHVFREVHTATELHERPQLTKLREAMARGEIAALVCYDPDRFSRMQVHTAILQDLCERAGVALKFAMFDFEASATGRFLLGARAFAAELELEKIKERTARGVRAKVASGKLHGRAHEPWGYRYDETRTRLIPDESNAPYVRMLFARYAAGESVRSLIRWLNDSGIPTPKRGKRWHRASVVVILRQRAYSGEALALVTRTTRERGKIRKVRLPEGEGIALPEGTIAPLVDRDIWEAAQRRLARNKAESTRRNREPEQFLLRAGFIICGICGRSLRARWRTANGQKYPIYTADEERHRECSAPARDFKMHARKLDAEVWQEVIDRIFDTSLLNADYAEERSRNPEADTLASVEKLIATTERAIRNVTAGLGMLEDDDARTPLLAEISALTARRRALSVERDGLLARQRDREAGEARRRSLLAFWGAKAAKIEKLDYQGRRDLLADLGVRVKLYPHGGYKIITREEPEELARGGSIATVTTPSGSACPGS